MYIVRNALMTPDGTIIESLTPHDYQSHTDANGERYAVSGGLSYLRHSLNDIPAQNISVTSDDDFETVRDHLRWGTYGLNGDHPFRRVALSEMSTDHIRALFKDGQALDPFRSDCLKKELKRRYL